jgi:hypothetical protein
LILVTSWATISAVDPFRRAAAVVVRHRRDVLVGTCLANAVRQVEDKPEVGVADRAVAFGVEAAVHGDATLLKQAMLHDPLCAAVCNPDEIWQMADEMLVALAPWLPQYKCEIPKARKRIESAKPLGLHKGPGAARLKTRSIAEMKRGANPVLLGPKAKR